jgi:mono/diheme cytochrome c family protein
MKRSSTRIEAEVTPAAGRTQRRARWLVVALLAETIALSAHAQDAVTVQRGKQVFDNWCAACHAPGPRHPGTQALEVLYQGAKPGALEQRTDLVPTLTQTFVRTGVSVMPPFRKTEIGDADLAALAAYLAPGARR